MIPRLWLLQIPYAAVSGRRAVTNFFAIDVLRAFRKNE